MECELQLSIEQEQEQFGIYLIQVHLIALEEEQRKTGQTKIADAIAIARGAFLREMKCTQ